VPRTSLWGDEDRQILMRGGYGCSRVWLSSKSGPEETFWSPVVGVESEAYDWAVTDLLIGAASRLCVVLSCDTADTHDCEALGLRIMPFLTA